MFNDSTLSKNKQFTEQEQPDRCASSRDSARSARGSAVDLSYAHIRPRGEAVFYVGGGLAIAKKPAVEKRCQVGGGKRGNIVGFSPSSRRRMLYMMAKTDISKKPFMITLTYPDEFSIDPERWKRDLKVFLQRLRREFPHSGGVWKLEPQKRGAAHFHLLAWVIGFNAGYLSAWVAKNWYEVVGSGDQKHLLWHLGCLGHGNKPCVEAIRSSRGVMAYAGKYVAKVSENSTLGEEWQRAGRWWGVWGVKFIPWAREVVEFLTYSQACRLFRLMRRHAHLKARQNPTITVFCNASFWLSNLDKLL